MNFGRERARISGMIVLAVIVKLVLVGVAVYAVVFLIKQPEAVGSWVHRLVSAF